MSTFLQTTISTSKKIKIQVILKAPFLRRHALQDKYLVDLMIEGAISSIFKIAFYSTSPELSHPSWTCMNFHKLFKYCVAFSPPSCILRLCPSLQISSTKLHLFSPPLLTAFLKKKVRAKKKNSKHFLKASKFFFLYFTGFKWIKFWERIHRKFDYQFFSL